MVWLFVDAVQSALFKAIDMSSACKKVDKDKSVRRAVMQFSRSITPRSTSKHSRRLKPLFYSCPSLSRSHERKTQSSGTSGEILPNKNISSIFRASARLNRDHVGDTTAPPSGTEKDETTRLRRRCERSSRPSFQAKSDHCRQHCD